MSSRRSDRLTICLQAKKWMMDRFEKYFSWFLFHLWNSYFILPHLNLIGGIALFVPRGLLRPSFWLIYGWIFFSLLPKISSTRFNQLSYSHNKRLKNIMQMTCVPAVCVWGCEMRPSPERERKKSPLFRGLVQHILLCALLLHSFKVPAHAACVSSILKCKYTTDQTLNAIPIDWFRTLFWASVSCVCVCARAHSVGCMSCFVFFSIFFLSSSSTTSHLNIYLRTDIF